METPHHTITVTDNNEFKWLAAKCNLCDWYSTSREPENVIEDMRKHIAENE